MTTKEYEIMIKIKGYEATTKTVKPIGNGAMIHVPKSWTGKKVKAILIEEITEKE